MSSNEKYQGCLTKEFAAMYTSTIDRQLFCDDPLIGLLGDISCATILDLGCGNGGFISRFVNARRVVGVDLSDNMLQKAREAFSSETNLFFGRSVAEHLPFADNSLNPRRTWGLAPRMDRGGFGLWTS